MRGTQHGVPFESGFEKKFLDQCYQLGIKVERCKSTVRYQDATGKWHTYYPDFYWPEARFVVEIKGAWAFKENHGHVKEKMMAALKYFEGRYTVITEKELRSDFVAKLYRGLKSGN